MDCSDYMQCEDTLELVILEEWEAYTNEINRINEANRRLCEIWVEEAGLSFPKIEDRCCADSQRQWGLTN